MIMRVKQSYPTQIENDIREIECALARFKSGKFMVWSAVHAAVGRLETSYRYGDGELEETKP